MKQPKGIVIYGVGNVGCSLARLATERGWPVVAAVNRPGAKVGRRLSEIAGCALPDDPIVCASLAEAIAGRVADVALVAVGDSLVEHMDLYRTCMARGLHVITASVEASYPKAVSPAVAADIDAFAREHGVVFNGSGFPDVFRIGLGALMAGASTRIDRLVHSSLVDIGPHGPEVARLAGAGLDARSFAMAFGAKHAGRLPFYQILNHHAVEAAGLTVRDISCIIEPVFSAIHHKLGAVDIPPGVTTGSRMVTRAATHEGVEFVGMNEIRIAEAGEVEFVEWQVEGPAPVKVRATDYDSGMSTNTQILNRIPDVLAAAPGLRTTAELGPPRFIGRR